MPKARLPEVVPPWPDACWRRFLGVPSAASRFIAGMLGRYGWERRDGRCPAG